MTRALLLAIRLHLSWLKESLSTDGRRTAPFSLPRLLILLSVLCLYIPLQVLHWLGFAIDEVLFSGYRKVTISKPVFISGIPRSGTTFVHRLLDSNGSHFSSFSTWEAVLAPSITERWIISKLTGLDKCLGAPIGKLLQTISKRVLRKTDNVHPIRLDASEEDYLSLLPIGGCFIAILLLPSSPSIWKLAKLHQLNQRDRLVLLDFYHRSLQRHLWFHGQEKVLLSKNAAFATWLPYLFERYPDARFIICIRPPEEALNSNLSSLKGALSALGNETAAPTIARELATVFQEGFACLNAFMEAAPRQRVALLDQPTLRRQPVEHLQPVLIEFGLKLDRPLEAALQQDIQEQPNQGNHRHTWFNDAPIPADFVSQTSPFYEQMRSRLNRSQPSDE